jgi:flagellar protein FlaG
MEISRIVQGGTVVLQHDLSTKEPLQVSDPRIAENQHDEEKELSKDFAKKVVDSLNTVLTASNSHLHFVYHEKLQKYYITIVDNQTKEVVKEIPPKKLLDIAAYMSKQIGLIVDKKI